MVDSAGTDPNSSKLQSELKSRDDKISLLQSQLDHYQQDRDEEMVRLNKKMELVMNEKDHQIKVNKLI